MASLRAARERGNTGGRPALSDEEILQVQVLMRDGSTWADDICEGFGISRPTLYRYDGPMGSGGGSKSRKPAGLISRR